MSATLKVDCLYFRGEKIPINGTITFGRDASDPTDTVKKRKRYPVEAGTTTTKIGPLESGGSK